MTTPLLAAPYRLTIFGKVEPPWYSLDFDYRPNISFRMEQANIDLTCSIQIDKSKVVIQCELNRWGDDVLPWVLNYVYDFVSAEIDLFTYATGKGFHVHLDQAQYPDGSLNYLISEAGPSIAALATACTRNDQNGAIRVEIKDLMPIVTANPALMLALRDLCAALKPGVNTLANCGRAIEGMRKSLWGRDETDRQEEIASWEKLRSTLRVSKPYLQSVMQASTQPRHGSSNFISGAVRTDALTKSWTIMNRLLLFHLGGKQPLSAALYPEL